MDSAISFATTLSMGVSAAKPPTGYPFHRMLFPVHVYIHYTDTNDYVKLMLQIKCKLTEEQILPFPVTCTTVLATGIDTDLGLFDVYVVGGHRRYRLGIVAEEQRPPTLVEVVDTVGWAAMRQTDSAEREPRRSSVCRPRANVPDLAALFVGRPSVTNEPVLDKETTVSGVN